MYDHRPYREHAIVHAGQFDYQGIAERWIQELDGRFKKRFDHATRWKNGRLYAELVKEQASLVKEVLELADAKSSERLDLAVHTEADATKALESAGWTRVAKPTAYSG